MKMRAPDGRVYDVPDDQAATAQRDQGFVPDTEAPAAGDGPKVTLKGRDGRLYQASPEEAATLQRDQDMELASPEETAAREHERELYGKYGSTGQQALGLAEAFYRNASLGVIKGLIGDEQEQRERAQVTSEESPVLYGAASVAPALAAGVATGGAGLGAAGTIAAEGALGGLAGVGSESDAAFIADRELSAEAAFGAFGKGAILGAAGAGAVIGAGRVIGAPLRNRFAEAAGRVERRAERTAFRSRGIDAPVEGLGDAVVDPTKAARMRRRGRAAADTAREEMAGVLQQLDETEQAAKRWSPPATAAEGDAAVQRTAIRADLDALRKDLEPIASSAEKGVVSRAFDMIDHADSPSALYDAVSIARRAVAESLQGAGDPAVAKVLQRGVERLEKLENNTSLFGQPATESAERAAALSDLSDARQALQDYLGESNYLENVGLRKGQYVDAALDSYGDKLSTVIRLSKGMPEAKQATQALRQLEKLRSGPLKDLAGLNQIDSMSGVTADDVRPQLPGGTEVLMDLAEQSAKYAAAPFYGPWKIAKLAWKARKLAKAATPGAKVSAASELATDALGMVDPIGSAKLAWKYRHHAAVLAEMAREQVTVAARNMVSSVKREGAIPLAARYAKEVLTEEEYNATRKAVETIIKEPDRLAEHLAGQLGDLPNEAPELVESVNAKAMAAVQFLSSKLPPSFGFSVMYPDGPPPSRMDVVEMSLYMRGVTDPEGVVQAIGDGSAMPEEIEAFRAVHPNWFSELQQAAHVEVAVANQNGEMIPAERLVQLETVLDLQGQLDPTFSDSIADVARSQQAFQKEQQMQKQASYRPAPKAGQRIVPGATQT